MAHLQRIPRRGDTFEYQGHRFTVLEMDGHRVAEVKIEPADTRQAQAGD